MDPDYVESVWWILKQIWDKGLLEEDFKVVPYCPRCETSLSSHEQHHTGSYQTVTDPSVFVRFPLVDEPDTSSARVDDDALDSAREHGGGCRRPDIDYVRVADPAEGGKHLILATERVEPLLGEDVEIVETIRGADLVGRRYTPPFAFVDEWRDAATRCAPATS